MNNLQKSILISAIALIAPFAVHAATLAISPSSQAFVAGTNYNVDILLDTKGAPVDGVDLYFLRYNPSLLQVIDSNASVAGTQITPGTLMPQTMANTVDSVGGKITFSQTTTGGSTYTGSGKLATITFKALANGTANVSFDFTAGSTSDTNVAGSATDKLTAVTNGTFTITGGTAVIPPPETTPPPSNLPAPTAADYPSGLVFKYASDPTVYILENGSKRPITDYSVLLNRIAPSQPIVTIPSTVTFPTGTIIGLRSGTLVKGSGPAIALVIEGTRYTFPTFEQFTSLGYNTSMVQTVDDNSFNDLPPYSGQFHRPGGTNYKYANNPTVYFLEYGNTRKGYPSLTVFNLWNANVSKIITVPDSETYPDSGLVRMPGGVIVKGSQPTIYLVFDGKLRPFSSAAGFLNLGYKFEYVRPITDADLNLHTIGTPIP